MSEVVELLPDESLSLKLKRKGVWIYILSFVVMPFSYIIKVIVSNELSVGDVGLMYSILGFVGILSVYNDLGLTDAIQYFVPKYTIQQKFEKLRGLLYTVVGLQLASGLLLGGGMLLGANWLASNYFSSPDVAGILQFFGVYFLLLNVFQAAQSFYFSLQHVKLEKTIELLRMGLVCLLVVGVRKASLLTLQTFAMSWLIALVLALSLSVWIFKKYYFDNFLTGPYEITKVDLKAWLIYGFWSLLGANAWTIISQIDLQTILYFSGKEAAGYRTNYMSITSLLTFAFVPLLAFCFPVFTELIEKKRFGELNRARKLLLVGIVLYAIVLGVITKLYGIEITTAIFGKNYLITGELLVYSAWIITTPLLGILNFQYIRSHGKIRRVATMQMIVVALHILVSWGIMIFTKNYFTLAIVLNVSHLAFFAITERYIVKHVSKHQTAIT